MTTRYEQATKGLTITRDGRGIYEAVKIVDGEDTWLCWAREWDAARAVLETWPEIEGDDGEALAYGELCAAVDGPTVSVIGSPRGTREARRALVTAALNYDLIDEHHPLAQDR